MTASEERAHAIICALVKATEWGPSEVCDNEDKARFFQARNAARQWLVDVADAARVMGSEAV